MKVNLFSSKDKITRFNRIFNKLMSVVVLIMFLYVCIFTISEIYDMNAKIKKYNYLYNKSFEDIPDIKKCEIFHCSALRCDTFITFFDKNIPMRKSHIYSNNIHIYGDIYFDTTLISFSYKTMDRFIYFNIVGSNDKNMAIVMFTLPLLLFIFIYIISSTIREEESESIILLAGNEALLANKSMINITENIHHELNTPLEVIDNKLAKIRKLLTDFLVEQAYNLNKYDMTPNQNLNKGILSLDEDFDLIQASSEQIYSVLEKMQGFKHLRYSNGNKSIKDIIDGGFKIISISNSNFEYKVDQKLNNYKLKHNKIKNADLLSIILNHIKNSLEANSSKIYIIVSYFKDDLLNIRILDNGNGIPKDAQKNIFNPNFSTKGDENGIRGNGMYLNKHIMETAGGKIKLISSSSVGTTIELSIPVYKINSETEVK